MRRSLLAPAEKLRGLSGDPNQFLIRYISRLHAFLGDCEDKLIEEKCPL